VARGAGLPLRIEPIGSGDLAAAAGLLARAFRDNPLNRAVIGEPAGRRLRCNQVAMRVHLPLAAASGSVRVARRERRLAGVLIAAPPGTWPFPRPGLGGGLRLVLGQGPRVVRRWSEVSQALQAQRWIGPHWYLASLAVEPELWGRGIGSALLRAWLEEVDAESARAYLETDSPENVGFYRRAGFVVERELRILGVPIHLMERPARRCGRTG